MDTVQANQPVRRPRLWIVETLVVLGVVAFGYFALTALETPRWSESTATAQGTDPLVNLLR